MCDYCTHIKVTDNVRLDLFTPSCFRLRVSELDGDKFPDKYEIPFAVGKIDAWGGVPYEETNEGCIKAIKTDELIIKLRSIDGYNGIGFIVYDSDEKRLFPVDAPKYGMFVNKCIVFDSASFFGEYSGCSRYPIYFLFTAKLTSGDTTYSIRLSARNRYCRSRLTAAIRRSIWVRTGIKIF